MKVEYIDSQIGIDVDMVITVSEFKKAEKSNKEFGFLKCAIDSYTGLYGTEFEMSKNQYNEILKRLPKTGDIVFGIKESTSRHYNPPRWCEIVAFCNNRMQPIVFCDDDLGNLVMTDL